VQVKNEEKSGGHCEINNAEKEEANTINNTSCKSPRGLEVRLVSRPDSLFILTLCLLSQKFPDVNQDRVGLQGGARSGRWRWVDVVRKPLVKDVVFCLVSTRYVVVRRHRLVDEAKQRRQLLTDDYPHLGHTESSQTTYTYFSLYCILLPIWINFQLHKVSQDGVNEWHNIKRT